jgi:hypothetical protein
LGIGSDAGGSAGGGEKEGEEEGRKAHGCDSVHSPR